RAHIDVQITVHVVDLRLANPEEDGDPFAFRNDDANVSVRFQPVAAPHDVDAAAIVVVVVPECAVVVHAQRGPRAPAVPLALPIDDATIGIDDAQRLPPATWPGLDGQLGGVGTAARHFYGNVGATTAFDAH